jgi:hypothetical protein
MWFEAGRRLSRDHQLRGCGCGLVAALDFCVYKGGFPPSSEQEEYRERIRELNRHYFFVVPFLGIAPYYYPLMVNRFLRKSGMPYRIRGTASARNTDAVRQMLEEDLPVIFCAGPAFPFFGRKHRLTLYKVGPDHQPVPSGQAVYAHFMTVTGIADIHGETWLRVASWGKTYYIRGSEYAEYTRYCYPGTNRFFRWKKV